MHDFANYRPIDHDDHPFSGGDRISRRRGWLSIGVLLGLIILGAGLRAAEHHINGAGEGELVEVAVEGAAGEGLEFDFYVELKRDDLYPPLGI